MKLSSVKTIAASARSHTHSLDQGAYLGQLDHSREDDSNGHFVTSPWEGLNWEPDPQEKLQAESELIDGIENFLKSRTYG